MLRNNNLRRIAGQNPVLRRTGVSAMPQSPHQGSYLWPAALATANAEANSGLGNSSLDRLTAFLFPLRSETPTHPSISPLTRLGLDRLSCCLASFASKRALPSVRERVPRVQYGCLRVFERAYWTVLVSIARSCSP